ncbi:MAG: hypothetical protein RBQ81_02930 [Arcobacteraceae bacterium]|jgi:tetrahydromethanopterin S-methyltransferase subunit B|nr:hypothetical protein [Arcobacteraceae bacterium]MDY0364800.1 hypothetical protein [Arcobacteraceae bacterium]
MSEMSFKQAKEIVERLELAELGVKQNLDNLQKINEDLQKTFSYQEKIVELIPKTNQQLTTLKLIVAVNFGFILGLLMGKFLL